MYHAARTLQSFVELSTGLDPENRTVLVFGRFGFRLNCDLRFQSWSEAPIIWILLKVGYLQVSLLACCKYVQCLW